MPIFFADRGDVAVLKTHVIKSPNLMGWLYWRFADINVENRGNGHNWRMPANLIADIWHVRYRRLNLPAFANCANCADRGDRRKLQSLHRAHLAIFADRGDWRIKSTSVSPALQYRRMASFSCSGDMAVQRRLGEGQQKKEPGTEKRYSHNLKNGPLTIWSTVF